MNICINCKYYVPHVPFITSGFSPVCFHPTLSPIIMNPVSGLKTIKHTPCEVARRKNGKCGEDGQLYEPKPPKLSLWKRLQRSFIKG
jgi:hypothetical protein